ncbi:MAG: HlyD family efflux transporter periplasmic adaptor subunit [bacterium]|nr:HlyD family efflux transporter periplasmic adaptor subunit [bacterium]
MRRKTIFIILISMILVLAGSVINCGNGAKKAAVDEHEGHDHGEDDQGHEGENVVHIKPEIMKKWGIQYAEAAVRDYVEKVELTGVAKENKDTTFIVNALVSGIVTEIKTDVGRQVKKGDLLCVLNSNELLNQKTNYIKAFQQYRLSKENFERTKKLFDIKAIQQKEFISRETEYKTAMADYFSLESELGTTGYNKPQLKAIKEAVIKDDSEKLKSFLSPYYEILAPTTGKVMMRDLSLGERVENNKTIFEVSDTRKLWVLLDAMEKELQYIESGKKATVVSDVYPDKFFNGRVLAIMEKIDPELRTIKVRLEVDNTEGLLKPEMYVKGRIEKTIKRSIVAFPASALVKMSASDGVFVIAGDGFQFKPVEVIEIDSNGYAFVNGLDAEELVITVGAFYLKAELEINKGSADPHAGHSH